MADSLGQAVLTLTADDGPLRAGLRASEQQARAAGRQIADAYTGQIVRAPAVPALRQQGVQGASSSGIGQGLLSGASSALPQGLGAAVEILGGGASAAAGVGLAIGAAGVAAVKTANDVQKLNNQLLVLTGSATTSKAVFDNLRQFAIATPFETNELVTAATGLQAFGFSARDAVEFTRRLGDVATVTGTPLEQLTRNLGQIKSFGKGTEVDIGQFLRAGLPIWESLSQVTGKTVAELKALDSISADNILAAIRQMTDEGGKFYQGGIKGGTELDRQWATLVDTLKSAALPLGQLLTPTILNAINNMINAVQVLGAAFEFLKTKVDEFGKTAAGKLLTEAVKFANIGALAVGRLAGGLPQGPKGPVVIPESAADKAKNNVVPTGRTKEDDKADQIALASAKAEDSLRKGAEKVRDAIAEGAAKLSAAFDKLFNARQAAFDLLTDDKKQQLLNRATDSIVKAVNTGEFSDAAVKAELGLSSLQGTLDFSTAEPEDIFKVADKASAVNSANAQIQQTLTESNVSLQAAINALAQKQWEVQVKINSGKITAEGDVLGGVQ